MKDNSLSDVIQKCRCHQPIFLFTNECLTCGLPLRDQHRMNLAEAPDSVGKPTAAYVAAVERAVEGVDKELWSKPYIVESSETNVYAQQIWNDAIEAAAKGAADYDGDGMNGGMDCHLGDAFQTRREIADEIRKLKK